MKMEEWAKSVFFHLINWKTSNLFISNFMSKKKLSIFKFMRKLNFFDYECIFFFIKIIKLNKINKNLPFKPGASTCAERK